MNESNEKPNIIIDMEEDTIVKSRHDKETRYHTAWGFSSCNEETNGNGMRELPGERNDRENVSYSRKRKGSTDIDKNDNATTDAGHNERNDEAHQSIIPQRLGTQTTSLLVTPESQTPTARVDQSTDILSRLHDSPVLPFNDSRSRPQDGTINNNDHDHDHSHSHALVIRRRRSNSIESYHLGHQNYYTYLREPLVAWLQPRLPIGVPIHRFYKVIWLAPNNQVARRQLAEDAIRGAKTMESGHFTATITTSTATTTTSQRIVIHDHPTLMSDTLRMLDCMVKHDLSALLTMAHHRNQAAAAIVVATATAASAAATTSSSATDF
jgi:hypothetical protein